MHENITKGKHGFYFNLQKTTVIIAGVLFLENKKTNCLFPVFGFFYFSVLLYIFFAGCMVSATREKTIFAFSKFQHGSIGEQRRTKAFGKICPYDARIGKTFGSQNGVTDDNKHVGNGNI